MTDTDATLARLRRSAFRRRFHLSAADRAYIQVRGMAVVARHTREFLSQRLAPARPQRDGRQTPWRGHPVFVAQHATATCCRQCLARWHQLPPGVALTPAQVDRLSVLILAWIQSELGSSAAAPPGQPTLFDGDRPRTDADGCTR